MAFLLSRAMSCVTRMNTLAGKNTFSTVSQMLAGKKGQNEDSSKSQSAQASNIKIVEPPAYIFKKVEGQVGPGASKSSDYKNPEYFSYHDMSFNDMEIVMAKLRCPQPSAVNKS